MTAAAERGRLRFRDRAVTRLAAYLATEVDAVGGVPGRLGGEGGARCAAVVDGGVTTVRLGVSVAYPHSVLATTRAVRAHVRERLGALTGLAVDDVRIEVVRLDRERVR
ncbi:MAG: Asp23/Gls24 family envelope stress response protein [Streptosporangiales bacterium]|nr:Asp23/Gls24 family envelope stress response protein [Streptosporangiales bacterium]